MQLQKMMRNMTKALKRVTRPKKRGDFVLLPISSLGMWLDESSYLIHATAMYLSTVLSIVLQFCFSYIVFARLS